MTARSVNPRLSRLICQQKRAVALPPRATAHFFVGVFRRIGTTYQRLSTISTAELWVLKKSVDTKIIGGS